MSWEIYLQAFEGGEAGQPDGRAIEAILEPLISRREPHTSLVVVATSDGSAEIYGYTGDSTQSLMITGIVGDAIWQTAFDLLAQGRMVAMPVGSPVCVPSDNSLRELPHDLRDEAGAIVVRNANDLAAAALGNR